MQQLRRALRLGFLRPGDRLPTVREVVARLAVNPSTVLRAYRELEHEGLLTLRAGSGTFVADGATAGLDQPLHQSLREELARWVESARARGADDQALGAIFDEALNKSSEEVLR